MAQFIWTLFKSRQLDVIIFNTLLLFVKTLLHANENLAVCLIWYFLIRAWRPVSLEHLLIASYAPVYTPSFIYTRYVFSLHRPDELLMTCTRSCGALLETLWWPATCLSDKTQMSYLVLAWPLTTLWSTHTALQSQISPGPLQQLPAAWHPPSCLSF